MTEPGRLDGRPSPVRGSFTMDLDEIRAFVAVVETRSFVSAARLTGFARATLRRRVDELEARAGVPLLDRSPTGVTVTPAGEVLAHRGRQILDETSALLSYVRDVGKEPSGVLRVVVPVGMPPETVPMTLGPLRARYPKLAFDVRYAEEPLGSLLSDFDLAVHWGARTPDGPWLSYELIKVREWLVASAHYLERHGTPADTDALSGHELLVFRPPGATKAKLPLLAGGSVEIEPAFFSSDAHHVRECAARGLGIAYVPDARIPRHDSVEMVPVLPNVVGRHRALRLVVPRTIADVPKIRAVVDAVTAMQKMLLALELP